jgi:hypothetical protein
MSLESKFIFNGVILVPDKSSIKIDGEFNYDGKSKVLGNISENGGNFDLLGGCLLDSNALGPKYQLNVLILNSSNNGKTKDLYFLNKGMDDRCGIYNGLVVPSSEYFNYVDSIKVREIIDYFNFMVDEKKQKNVKLELGLLE